MTICLNERGTPLAQGFENDIDGGLPFYPQSVSSSGTYWLAYVNPSDMKEILTEEYFDRWYEDTLTKLQAYEG